MSFFDCVDNAIAGKEVDKAKGERAQKLWKELSDQYERDGYTRHNAEALAGEDVKVAFKKEFGDKRHTFTAQISANRRIELSVKGEEDISKVATRTMTTIDLETRSLVRRFNGRLGDFLQKHHPDLLGRVTDPTGFKNILKELHGEASNSVAAQGLTNGIKAAKEDLRLMFNEAGGLIGKLDDHGLPHTHNRLQVTNAGFDTWFRDTVEGINWARIENKLTGRPFQPEGAPPPSLEVKQSFLKEIYDNIEFGKTSKEVIFGKPVKSEISLTKERVLHFKTADDWIDYNKKYGMGSPFNALINHVEGMSREVATMRRLGPKKRAGARYQADLLMNEARNRGTKGLADKVEKDSNHAERMLNILSGGAGSPQSREAQRAATFFSTTRNTISSAFLDRAVVASMSDFNSMRLAADAVGLNRTNIMSTYVNLMSDTVKGGGMKTDDLLRQQWIADTRANPAVTMSRFQTEWPGQEWSSVLVNSAMRVQGLASHTDNLKISFQEGFSALFASNAKKGFGDLDANFGQMLREHGITEVDWDRFRDPSGAWTAENGATFINPLYWREAVKMDSKIADDVFLKFQSLTEKWTEVAVPSRSVKVQAWFSPEAYNLPPGSVPYEIMKSGTMFKSFVMAFADGQASMIGMQKGAANKALYVANMFAGATIMGGLALQVGDLLLGRDPRPMDNWEFWSGAALKGGGLGPVGDIVAAGQASWGGGFVSYLGGPVWQTGQDAWDLSIKNAVGKAQGKDVNFAADLARMAKRYTPLGQTPALIGGAALDRMVWDQLQLMIDPESVSALERSSKARKRNNGNKEFWLPGQALPSRAPDFSSAFGQ